VRDRTLAEDLVQETFVVALERADARVPAASERAWLFGIARRLAAAALRSRRGFLGLLRRIVRMEPAARPGDVVELAEDGARSPVAAAVASLPARQREVLYLVFHEGMTLDDAAHALEISPGAARQHYHRAKETLRARLAGSSEAAGVEP
jgi:RNA polymerase sigma-70 factor (ECF subfamily)